MPIYDRFLDDSLAGETRNSGPYRYRRGCLRLVSPARLGCQGLAYIGEAA